MEPNKTKNLNEAEQHNASLESTKKAEQSTPTIKSDINPSRGFNKTGNYLPEQRYFLLNNKKSYSPLEMILNPFYAKELEIKELIKKAFSEATENDQGKISELTKKLEELGKELEKERKAKLNQDIEDAKEALANSLNSATRRISEYRTQARLIQKYVKQLFCLDLIIILGFVLLMWLGSSTFIAFFEKNTWSLIFFTFPVVIILTIAITLLRHQKKLMDEVRHYSAEKRQIELYSGLLKASQHAAANLNDPQKSAEYVQETFTAIRNRILSEHPHSNTAASASEKEDYGLEAIVKIIADLAAKNEAKK